MASTTQRRVISVNDYPEHLNPFREEDNHNKIRFWTIGRKSSRTNSFSLSSGLKDFRNTWSLKSFMKKGKKKEDYRKPQSAPVNGENSPIVYRRNLDLAAASQTGGGSRSTIASPERYVYGGSVTPLPRSRFQERLRSTSQQDVDTFRRDTERASFSTNRGFHREYTGSQFSVESSNPFEGPPQPPVRASRRKKNRAPAPPPASSSLVFSPSTLDSSAVSEDESKDVTTINKGITDGIDPSLNVELKIIEDIDVKYEKVDDMRDTKSIDEEAEKNKLIDEINLLHKEMTAGNTIKDESIKDEEAQRDVLIETSESVLEKSKDLFKKVDIKQYRRNSSLNEDDFQLRRAHFDDTTPFKRSKSMTNSILTNGNTIVIHDIPLHINEIEKDHNHNETELPKKVVCKVYNNSTPRKPSLDNSISSTEKEFIEIDKATRHLEDEIKKLNKNLNYDDIANTKQVGWTVSEIKMKFENGQIPKSPNPIPKPRRSYYGSSSPINGNPEVLDD